MMPSSHSHALKVYLLLADPGGLFAIVFSLIFSYAFATNEKKTGEKSDFQIINEE